MEQSWEDARKPRITWEWNKSMPAGNMMRVLLFPVLRESLSNVIILHSEK